MGRAKNRSVQTTRHLSTRNRAEASNDFTNGYLTCLKSKESTRNLADPKSVMDHEVQIDGVK